MAVRRVERDVVERPGADRGLLGMRGVTQEKMGPAGAAEEARKRSSALPASLHFDPFKL